MSQILNMCAGMCIIDLLYWQSVYTCVLKWFDTSISALPEDIKPPWPPPHSRRNISQWRFSLIFADIYDLV